MLHNVEKKKIIPLINLTRELPTYEIQPTWDNDIIKVFCAECEKKDVISGNSSALYCTVLCAMKLISL